MTIIYFDELKESNRVVLEMVEVDDKHVKKEEASFLLKQIRLYYLNKNEQDNKHNLMSCFISRPAEFKHMDLIKQLETENLKLETTTQTNNNSDNNNENNKNNDSQKN